MALSYVFRVYPTEEQIHRITVTLARGEEGVVGFQQQCRFVWNIVLRQYLNALAANYQTLLEQQRPVAVCKRLKKPKPCLVQSERGLSSVEKAARRLASREKMLTERARARKGLPSLEPPPPVENPSPVGSGVCHANPAWNPDLDSGESDLCPKPDLWANGRKPVYLKPEEQLRDLRDFMETPEGAFLKGLYACTRAKVVQNMHKAWVACYRGNARRPRFKTARDTMSLYYTGKPELCPSAKAKPASTKPSKSKSLWYQLGPRMENFKVPGCREFYYPGVGSMPLRLHRPMPADPKSVVLKEDGGQWFAVFATEETRPPLSIRVGTERLPITTVRQAIGIDLGLVNLLTDSTGQRFENLRALDKVKDKIKALEQLAARKDKGSGKWEKVQAKIRAVYRKARRVRQNYYYQIANQIAQKASFVVFEDLNLRNMTASAKGDEKNPGTNVAQKSGLNRSFQDAALGELRRIITYVVEHSGGMVTRVPPQNTSLRCSRCGYTDTANRPSQAVFKCVSCGHTEHADVNAAKNILALGMEKLASGEVAEEYAAKAKQEERNNKRRAEMRLMASLPKDQRIARKAQKEAEFEATKEIRAAARLAKKAEKDAKAKKRRSPVLKKTVAEEPSLGVERRLSECPSEGPEGPLALTVRFQRTQREALSSNPVEKGETPGSQRPRGLSPSTGMDPTLTEKGAFTLGSLPVHGDGPPSLFPLDLRRCPLLHRLWL